MKPLTALFLFSTLFFLSTCTEADNFEIHSPRDLKEWASFQASRDFETEILPFGHIPWGRKITGRLALSSPSDACDTITFQDQPSSNFILVAQRDNCDLYVKAQNAQKAGAKMLIIVDDSSSKRFASITVPPGSIDPINIPSVMVTKLVGDKLMTDLSLSDPWISQIDASYNFALVKKKILTYNLVLSSSNRDSFNFLKEWKPYYDIVKNLAQLQPIYAYGRLYQMGDIPSTECLCNSYCAVPEYKTLPLTGADAMMEDLRQICVLKTLGLDQWWQYVLAYGEFCLDQANVKECGSQIISGLGFDAGQIDSCVTSSFEGGDDACRNVIFDQTSDGYSTPIKLKYNNIPTLSIKDRRDIKNVFPAIGTFEAFCETFSEKPEGCYDVYDTSSVNPDLNKINPPPSVPSSGLHIELNPQSSSGSQPRPEPQITPEPSLSEPSTTSSEETRPEIPDPGPEFPKNPEFEPTEPFPQSEMPASKNEEKISEGDFKTNPSFRSNPEPKSELYYEDEGQPKKEEGNNTEPKEIVVQETSGPIGIGYLILVAVVILVGLFFWRRHSKRNHYQRLETPVGAANSV